MFSYKILILSSCLSPILAIPPPLSELQDQVPQVANTPGSKIQNVKSTLKGGLDILWDNFNDFAKEELDDMTPKDRDAFDFIVVGAGSAGAAIAARLSEVKDVTVLLIEAGGKENSFLGIPVLAHYLQLLKTTNWGDTVEPSPRYCRGMVDKRCNMPRGKVMGGSSVLNLMIETRGNRRDYDNWENLGCEGWSYKDVLPLFKKMENFDVKDSTIEPRFHGTGGPVNIEKSKYQNVLTEAFIKAGIELGYPEVDYDGKNQIGYSIIRATLKNGSRCSSNRAYLHKSKGRPNLFLTSSSVVDKVLIDDVTKRAYGVIFKKLGRRTRVLAKREVIVSAGAINSPKLLMLSGIGPEKHLSSKGIPVLKNAPVGENLIDHISYYGLNFLVNDSVSVLASKILNLNSSDISDYLNYRVGPVTLTGGTHALSFVDVDNPNSRDGVPNIELLFVPAAAGSEPLMYKAFRFDSRYSAVSFANMVNRESFMIIPVLLSPKSRGNILLRSRNPDDKTILNLNYFSHPDDMRRMILGVREALRVSQTRAMQKYNAQIPRNPVPGCNHLEADSDDYWDCCIRTYASTIYHPAGTCKMGAQNDPSAVVNPRLKVIGIDGLRIADASIMPTIISGHPNVPVMMIGEKLAQMVKEDWKLI